MDLVIFMACGEREERERERKKETSCNNHLLENVLIEWEKERERETECQQGNHRLMFKRGISSSDCISQNKNGYLGSL